MFENDKPTAQSNLAHNIYVNANREINRLRKKLTIKNIEIKRLRAEIERLQTMPKGMLARDEDKDDRA
jgi:hypothetical protein